MCYFFLMAPSRNTSAARVLAAPESTGVASIDRIFANLHPREERFLRGEATDEELFQVPGIDDATDVTLEEACAWLEGERPARTA